MFIDTYYDKIDSYENDQFLKNTHKLFDFAKNRDPFECKDIQIAKTEISELKVSPISLLIMKRRCNLRSE